MRLTPSPSKLHISYKDQRHSGGSHISTLYFLRIVPNSEESLQERFVYHHVGRTATFSKKRNEAKVATHASPSNRQRTQSQSSQLQGSQTGVTY
ncbi:uncharacterized protein YALI1_C26566g [Yarrowia lipolytica]|uniref:Uncharacterized protein n=1 Tax=Yarrowia lipolytica TaxID=4952 RepID=A0A1D8NBT2_YARLL|nr:hypothetical protein YALI1_C26566g [Yarrowia lipolytica]